MTLVEEMRPDLSRELVEIPRGDRNPVLLLPGFLEPGFALLPMVMGLRALGIRASPSSVGINLGNERRNNLGFLEDAERLAEECDEPVVLVAHSLAGLSAHVLARQRPDIIKGVVTVGSPSPHSPIDSIFFLGRPLAHLLEHYSLDIREFIEEMDEPPAVPEHHIHSKIDRVVRHGKHCVGAPYFHHTVIGEHASLMLNLHVLSMIRMIVPQNRT